MEERFKRASEMLLAMRRQYDLLTTEVEALSSLSKIDEVRLESLTSSMVNLSEAMDDVSTSIEYVAGHDVGNY